MKILYRIYQIFVAVPLLLLTTLLTSISTIIGCALGGGRFWGYYPAHWWSIGFCRILLLPVHVEGRENIDPDRSYIFVANHQGAMDIFLVMGFLNHKFRWMMKKALRKIPFVGAACAKAQHIFEDHSGTSGVARTIADARQRLEEGNSIVVFPEGTRSRTGHIGRFHRGAFLLADELQIPVVPLTIEGAFEVLDRNHSLAFVRHFPLRLTIHKPIYHNGGGRDNIQSLSDQSYAVIRNSLPERYQ